MADPDRCPICGNPFKSDKCPHSYDEVVQRQQQNKDDVRINKLIDARLKKYGLLTFKE